MIEGKKRLTKTGGSLILIIDKAFIPNEEIKPGDFVHFKLEKLNE